MEPTNRTQTMHPAQASPGLPVRQPRADIFESEDGISLMLEIPGAGADDIDITFDKGVLSISATPSVSFPEQLDLVHAEFAPGIFRREFAISETLDPDRIEAELKNGVLKLFVPRAEASKPRKIQIKTG